MPGAVPAYRCAPACRRPLCKGYGRSGGAFVECAATALIVTVYTPKAVNAHGERREADYAGGRSVSSGASTAGQ